MVPEIIIPEGTALFQSLKRAAMTRKLVFLAGIPGVGKSLYVQQLVLLAQKSGRTVHLFQYDVTRTAFENHPLGLQKYPEVDGVTHPMIRRAVGVWARRGVLEWLQTYADERHILIGEVPLIGSRLIELMQIINDEVESVLAGPQTLFMIPVPSNRIRDKIVAQRAISMEKPRHKKEEKDAPINVLQMVWADAHQLAVKLGLTQPLGKNVVDMPYDPAVYAAVYEYLCQNRQVETLHVDLDLKPTGSVYDLTDIASEPKAKPEDVKQIIEELETNYSLSEIAAAAEQWYEIRN